MSFTKKSRLVHPVVPGRFGSAVGIGDDFKDNFSNVINAIGGKDR